MGIKTLFYMEIYYFSLAKHSQSLKKITNPRMNTSLGIYGQNEWIVCDLPYFQYLLPLHSSFKDLTLVVEFLLTLCRISFSAFSNNNYSWLSCPALVQFACNWSVFRHRISKFVSIFESVTFSFRGQNFFISILKWG